MDSGALHYSTNGVILTQMPGKYLQVYRKTLESTRNDSIGGKLLEQSCRHSCLSKYVKYFARVKIANS